MSRMDCGVLGKADARAWKHWWTVRGYLTTLDRIRTGRYQCWLTLERGIWIIIHRQ